MEIKKKYTPQSYYAPSKNLRKQIERGSSRKKESSLKFVLKKSLNFILERLAYNCPVNSWRIAIHRLRGVNIGENVFIGLQVTLDHSYPEYIYIGDNVSLAGNNFVLTHSNPYIHFEKTFDSYVAPVVIDDFSWLSIGVMILPGVTVGKYSIVAAGAVVSKDIPEKVIAGGIPAKVIKGVEL